MRFASRTRGTWPTESHGSTSQTTVGVLCPNIFHFRSAILSRVCYSTSPESVWALIRGSFQLRIARVSVADLQRASRPAPFDMGPYHLFPSFHRLSEHFHPLGHPGCPTSTIRLRSSLGHSWSAYCSASTLFLVLVIVTLALISNWLRRYLFSPPCRCLLCPVEEVLGRTRAQPHYGLHHRVLWAHHHRRKWDVTNTSHQKFSVTPCRIVSFQ